MDSDLSVPVDAGTFVDNQSQCREKDQISLLNSR